MSDVSVRLLKPLDLQAPETVPLLARVHALALKQAAAHVMDISVLPSHEISQAVYIAKLAEVLDMSWSQVAYIQGPGGEGFLNLSAAVAVTRDETGATHAIQAIQVDDMTTLRTNPDSNTPDLGFSVGSIAAAIARRSGAKALIWECDQDSLTPYYYLIGAHERRECAFRFTQSDIQEICASASNPDRYRLLTINTAPTVSLAIGRPPETIGFYDADNTLVARASVFPRVSVIREVGGRPNGTPEGHIGVQIEGLELTEKNTSPATQTALLDQFMRQMIVFFKENIEDFGFADLVVNPGDPVISELLQNFNVGPNGYTGTSRLWIMQGDGFERAANASKTIRVDI